jgi:hypothetical protein
MMINMILTKYGPFGSIVSIAGSLMAMATALGWGWRRRAKWEPAEEDVPNAPQRVGSLLAACTVGLIWAQLSDGSYLPLLTRIAALCLTVTLVSMLVYGLLINGLVYDRVLSKTRMTKIIGGLWKTDIAIKAQEANQVTTQELLAGAQYNTDRVWPRLARGLSKVLFTLSYLGLTVGGTVALGSVSIIVGLKTKR